MKKNGNSKSRAEYEKFSKEWFRDHSKNDREMFELIAMYFPAMLAAFIWALLDPKYHGPHVLLAFSSVIVFLWFLIGRSEISDMLNSTKKTLFEFRSVQLNDLTYSLVMGSGLLAVISVLFVINLEILSNSSVRIGAVAAFGLFTLLKQVFMSFKK